MNSASCRIEIVTLVSLCISDTHSFPSLNWQYRRRNPDSGFAVQDWLAPYIEDVERGAELSFSGPL